MTLPASGAISLSQVNTELSLTANSAISMNSSAVRTLFGVASGPISLSNGYGKSNVFSFTISSNQTNANLRTLAIAAGWNQSATVSAVIASGVYISSNSTATPALTISGTFSGGVSLTNNGFIVGMGGAGGNGVDPGSNGSAGGLALSASVAVSITNNGTIAGGGGGGGGGGVRYSAWDATYFGSGGGGGGGRSSAAANSAGGAKGANDVVAYGVLAQNGNAGTLSAPGTGGLGTYTDTGQYQGSGGTGGAWGSSGVDGWDASTSYYYYRYRAPTLAGSGGAAVSGNANISWAVTGTRLGAIA